MVDGPYSESRQNQLRAEYQARINRVMDYVEANLGGELTLSALADIAAFSPYHFHRIFRAMVGETLCAFVQRARLEKGAALLTHSHKKSITEIALDCGYTSPATFARVFRERFGTTATEWRDRKSGIADAADATDRKNGIAIRKYREERDVVFLYGGGELNQPLWRFGMNSEGKRDLRFDVEVKEEPDFTVAYVRHVGAYDRADSSLFGQLLGRLSAWAVPRGIMGQPGSRLLAVYHDPPEITEKPQQRLSVCMTVPSDTQVEGDVGKMVVSGGVYAVGHFEIDADQYAEAWNALTGDWLPQSGYQPADGVCFEDYRNDPSTHPEGKHQVDIYLPVRPL